MRDFGFGRRFDKLENLMDDEIRNVIDYIRNGKPHSLDTVRQLNYFIQFVSNLATSSI